MLCCLFDCIRAVTAGVVVQKCKELGLNRPKHYLMKDPIEM
jgi:hypothetical protein